MSWAKVNEEKVSGVNPVPLKTRLASEPGVRNPGGLAAAIDRRIIAKGGK